MTTLPPTTSPDPLAEELRDIANASPPNLVTWRGHTEFVVRRAAARIEADSELLRLADTLAQMVTETPNRYTVGDVTDMAERFRRARREESSKR